MSSPLRRVSRITPQQATRPSPDRWTAPTITYSTRDGLVAVARAGQLTGPQWDQATGNTGRGGRGRTGLYHAAAGGLVTIDRTGPTIIIRPTAHLRPYLRATIARPLTTTRGGWRAAQVITRRHAARIKARAGRRKPPPPDDPGGAAASQDDQLGADDRRYVARVNHLSPPTLRLVQLVEVHGTTDLYTLADHWSPGWRRAPLGWVRHMLDDMAKRLYRVSRLGLVRAIYTEVRGRLVMTGATRGEPPNIAGLLLLRHLWSVMCDAIGVTADGC